MLNVMRFWLDKGVDGFRVDVILFMVKDDRFRDESPKANWNGTDCYDSLRHIYALNRRVGPAAPIDHMKNKFSWSCINGS